MGTELVPVDVALTKRELAESRLYPNIRTASQAAVVIARARAYGLCPTVVAEGLYFVGGKPAMSAQLVATLVKRSGKYDYRVRDKTEKSCSIEFFEIVGKRRESLGTETFSFTMAQRAGLISNVNWKKFPEAMLWARALTAGVRARCPDACGGGPVYCVEELSPTTPVDEEGRPLVTGEVVDAEVVPPAPSPALQEVRNLLAETGTDEQSLLSYYGASRIEELSAADLDHALETLTTKRRAL